VNRTFLLIVLYGLCLFSCGQESKIVKYFKDTEAYELAQSVEKNDTLEIKKIVKENSNLLEVTNPISGSNVLDLAVILENYEAFKALIDLGANPNFINPLTERSVLINACKFYWKPEPYTIDLRYMDLLLQKGANPNYALEKDFTNEKGIYQRATSAIHEASKLDLRMVKVLIEYGADPYKKLKQHQNPPFYDALTGFGNRIEISEYFIDSLKVNINEPLAVIEIGVTKKKNVIFILDVVMKYTVNSYIESKIKYLDLQEHCLDYYLFQKRDKGKSFFFSQ
jgi:ankyrin repeat protein